MGKCLVTKLKESVTGNFPVLGELLVDVEVASNTPTNLRHITIKTYEPIASNVYIRTTDGSAKLSASSDFSNPTNKLIPTRPTVLQDIHIYLLEGTYTIAISHKYELSSFVAEASESNPGVIRNLKFGDFEYTKLNYFYVMYNPYIIDSLDNVPDTMIRLNATGDQNITGNISVLSKLSNALAIRIYKSTTQGTLESLCEGIIQNTTNPRTTQENLAVDVRLTSITLNGVVPNEELTVVFSGSGCTIKNGSNNTIATYNGSTWTYV